MSTLFKIALSSHVIFGLIGVIAVYAVWMSLLKKNPSIGFLKYASLTAFVSYMVSWISGGYYYVLYYGSNVKPLIKGGDYSWAHIVVMETKEHVFLMLPFGALVLAAAFWLVGDRVLSDQKLRRTLSIFTAIIAIIAIAITISGILISGGAR